MSLTLAEKNEVLKKAVEARREAQAAGKPHDEWYEPVTEPMPEKKRAEVPAVAPRGPSAAEVLERFAPERPGSLAFLEKLGVIRELHFKKTAEYGDPQDPFANVTASAKCGVEPWRRALCDASDCNVRLQRYANGQPVDFENAIMDNINWLLICWVKHDEAKRA